MSNTDKQDLIFYLEEQKSQRLTKINDYGDACERLEIAKRAYENAQKAVEDFGDMTDLHAEVEKIDGFINLLTNETNVEDNTFAETTVCDYETTIGYTAADVNGIG